MPHENRVARTNTTIIKLSETGTIINNTMVPLIADKVIQISKSKDHDSRKKPEHQIEPSNLHQQHVADIRFVSRKTETQTVTVEVHSDDGKKHSSKPSKPPPPPPPPPTVPIKPSNKVPTSSLQKNTPSVVDCLGIAISEELKKRSQVSNKSQPDFSNLNCSQYSNVARNTRNKSESKTLSNRTYRHEPSSKHIWSYWSK